MKTIHMTGAEQRGVALIFTLLVMAVLITLVATLSTTSKVDIVQAENVRDNIQNEVLIDSAIRLIEHVLLQDMQRSEVDSRLEPWARPAELKIGDAVLSWEVEDEGGKLNINLLAFGAETKRRLMEDVLARLVRRVSADNGLVSRAGASGVIVFVMEDPSGPAVQGIMDFLKQKVDEAVANGAVVMEDQKIRVLRPILFEVDELIQAEGMTKELLYGHKGNKGLADFLTVWSDDFVNINTAPKQVLMALSESMDENAADAVIDYRAGNSFQEVEDLTDVESVDQGVLKDMVELASVRSRFFVAHLKVKTGRLQKTALAVLRRPNLAKVIAEESPPTVSVIYFKPGA